MCMEFVNVRIPEARVTIEIWEILPKSGLSVNREHRLVNPADLSGQDRQDRFPDYREIQDVTGFFKK